MLQQPLIELTVIAGRGKDTESQKRAELLVGVPCTSGVASGALSMKCLGCLCSPSPQPGRGQGGITGAGAGPGMGRGHDGHPQHRL